MATTAANVSAGKPKVGGAIYYASADTTSIPSDASTDISTYTDFVCLGYVSEDGLTNAFSQEFENQKAWGGDVVNSSLTETSDTFSFKLIEVLNSAVQAFAYGSDNVTVDSDTGAMAVDVTTAEPDHYALVVDMVLKGDVAHRIVVPDCMITEREEITYTDSDAIAYGFTCTAYPDSDGVLNHNYYE